MVLHRRPEFNADLASGSADDHIALSIVHLVSRKLRLMLIVVFNQSIIVQILHGHYIPFIQNCNETNNTDVHIR